MQTGNRGRIINDMKIDLDVGVVEVLPFSSAFLLSLLTGRKIKETDSCLQTVALESDSQCRVWHDLFFFVFGVGLSLVRALIFYRADGKERHLLVHPRPMA